MNTYEKVYALVSLIPQGKVLTYSIIAKKIGIHPRFVGTILHKNPNPSQVPCYKVVNRQGRLAENFAFGGLAAQEEKLRLEGILLENGKVNLRECLWKID